MFPTALLLGLLGCHSLWTRKSVYLGKHFFKLIRGGVDNPTILAEIGFWVPERPRPSRSRPLFIPVRARTHALSDAPLTKAISLLNRLSEDVDLFNVDYNEYVEALWMTAQDWEREEV
jgi:hypothetical protein